MRKLRIKLQIVIFLEFRVVFTVSSFVGNTVSIIYLSIYPKVVTSGCDDVLLSWEDGYQRSLPDLAREYITYINHNHKSSY